MSANTHKRKLDRRNIILLVALAVLLIAAAICFTPLKDRITQGLDIQGGLSVIMTADHSDGSEVTTDDMEKAVAIVTNRVNKLGASEATVQQQGDTSILIQIPGVENAEQALSTIGTTGALEFVDLRDITDTDMVKRIESGETGMGLEPGTYTAFMTGDSIQSVTIGQETQTSAYYAVNLNLDSTGTASFATITTDLVSTNGQIAIVLDGVVNSAPAVQSAITDGDVAITGNYTLDEAKSLQTVLESGALPVDLSFSESRVVGPTLGQDSLNAGLIAMAIGFILVGLYLLVFYRGLGALTVLNLLVFATLYLGILAVLSYFGLFALSLAGIAGIVLTIGLAADSSILVLERFKEEIRMGRSVKAASISGVRHAIRTSIDADMVTLVSALALFFIAVGPVKGFGLTLGLGIVCDVVTMIIFKAPIIRLLAPSQIEKNPGFWGVTTDIEEGSHAEEIALKGGARNA
ncbi:MAG: protein translocase subunit SecD [Actinobacteria bacterium]|nr:protein translocase subunit SecD [Actinomycetota bacterium]